MDPTILIALEEELSWHLPSSVTLKQGGEGIAISCDGSSATLAYKTNADLARGLVLLKQFGTEHAYTHEEKCSFETLGLMLDCSRNAVMTVESVKRLLRLLALMGYNMLQLYTEDTYEVDGEPYFGYLRGRYSKEEMKELDAYAKELGIEMIPCIQVLAHLNAIFKWQHYSAKYKDCGDILLCGDEKVYTLIERMFATLAECYTSRRIHIGMDEAHMVGLGKYLDRNGYRDRFDILAEHLKRVCEIAEKYGFRPMMWSDMFFRLAANGKYYLDGEKCEVPERVFQNLPEDISLVYWDYYHTDRKSYDEMVVAHKKFNREIWFAGGAWKWVGFTPDNEYSLRATAAATLACAKNGVKHLFTTAWGDEGAECSPFAVLPTLAYTASLAYGNRRMAETKRFFRSLTGIRFDDFMAIDSLNKLYPANCTAMAKFLTYNDPLVGMRDKTVEQHPEIVEKAAACLSTFSRLSKNKQYGYLFRTQKQLAHFLSLKADFGVRLRRAYQSNDRETLVSLCEECKRISTALEKFYDAFRAQWMQENKPFGFDIQDLRLGGLLQRMKVCRNLISEYLDGKREDIEELEIELLPDQLWAAHNWATVVSANVLYHFGF
ncbi:MAG: beta-N-acetylhexosaminidase [Clostridia bacterium]|nr:beta-N-acetylhexosaminidase [Clostridia bacterium]